MQPLRQFQLATISALVLGAFGLPKEAIAGYVVPTSSVGTAVVVPTIPIPATRPATGGNLPSVVVPPSPNRPPVRPVGTLPPTLPAPTTTNSNGTNFNYRVIVTPRTANDQTQVRAIIPGAFRTTVNGQSVIQAGVFRESSKANEVYQALISNNLQASIVPFLGSINPAPTPASSPAPNPNPTTPPRPIPNSRAIVVIDPGHGGRDPGAVGIGGLQEKIAVLDISRQVVSLLAQQGIQASLTRSNDQEIDLEPRVDFAERANADVFVSIHANSISMSRPDINGLETYYYSGSNGGKQLAQVIHNALLQGTDMDDRGVKTANFYVIKYTPMPAVLVEVGFVTGREDAARLSSAAGRTKLAQAIAKGIIDYIRTN